ncbi:hypothetical protein SNE40_020491 [Patella caerulea]|uniref:Uncharacterized protein n=1 Tax=Patella caerulea TaxID=87958 RepID=A0AAN8GHR4_PATCE
MRTQIILLFLSIGVLCADAYYPCATVRCGIDEDGRVTQCRLREVTCIQAPCYPQVVCVADVPATEGVCDIGLPVINSANHELYCGRGSSGRCPASTGCVIDAGDRYALCCYTG